MKKGHRTISSVTVMLNCALYDSIANGCEVSEHLNYDSLSSWTLSSNLEKAPQTLHLHIRS